jgi:uracil-DNA glycosylase
MRPEEALKDLQEVVVGCRKCPRLVAYLQEVARNKVKRFRHWDYWARPLPSFGDPSGRLLVVGLAPAAHGGTRTGRMFTGDRSGEWLFRALYESGFANRPGSERRDDGFVLIDAYITATIRCAPPQNKPLPEEIENCRPYILEELDLLKNIRVAVLLGQIAFTQTCKSLRHKGFEVPRLPFGHGHLYEISAGEQDRIQIPAAKRLTLITTYHPSQQNTQTGKLTRPMFQRIFEMAREKVQSS